MGFISTSQCFSPLSTVLLFPQSRSVCVRFILFSDLGVSQVNNWCLRPILKLRSVRLSTAGGASSSACSPSGASVNGGTQRCSQKPSVCGCTEQNNCVFVIACVCVHWYKCVCKHVYVCVLSVYISTCVCLWVWLVHSITQSTMQSESHPVLSWK